jgi:hypothetical protein
MNIAYFSLFAVESTNMSIAYVWEGGRGSVQQVESDLQVWRGWIRDRFRYVSSEVPLAERLKVL